MKDERGVIGFVALIVLSIAAGVATNVISAKITQPVPREKTKFEVYNQTPLHVKKCFEKVGTINGGTVCVDEGTEG